MVTKKDARVRRARKTRARIKTQGMPRLSVYRTPRHIYAQVILPDGNVKVSASTLDAEVKVECKNGGNVSAAKAVGKIVAKRALAAKIEKVAFDRAGFRYHGRIAALAESAREQGLVI